jgi:hypothetical protein
MKKLKNPQRQQNNQRRGRIELLNDPETLSDDIAHGLPVLFEVHFPIQVLKIFSYC